MTNKEALLQNCKNMLAENNELENIISFLRNNGCSKTESIVILKNAKEITLDEAKYLIHFSSTWQDKCEQGEELHTLLDRMLIEKKPTKNSQQE